MPAKCKDEVDSALILGTETLCVVVNGKSLMWPISREKIFRLIESGVAAIRKQEEGN